jgi:hypothetical protein
MREVRSAALSAEGRGSKFDTTTDLPETRRVLKISAVKRIEQVRNIYVREYLVKKIDSKPNAQGAHCSKIGYYIRFARDLKLREQSTQHCSKFDTTASDWQGVCLYCKD